MIHSFVVSILILVSAFGPDGDSTMSTIGPIVVDGDTATRIVASHPDEPAVTVAGERGLYRSSGSVWTVVGPAPPAGRLVSSGGDIPILLAGDHPPCLRGGSAVQLQRSDDGGQSWSSVSDLSGMRPLAIWPDSGIALASSCAGLQFSLDLGLTWSLLPGIELGWELTSFAEVPQTNGEGPVVLVGLTGEGGTSYLRSIDFTDPAAPVVSNDLRMYYAIGGLAGEDDTYVLAAMDGVWTSEDAGSTWQRSRTGLEAVTLDRDPAEFGLPADLDPSAYGLFSIAMLGGATPGMIVGSADGLYTMTAEGEDWVLIRGTSGQVNDVRVDGEGSLVVYETDEGVSHFTIGTGS